MSECCENYKNQSFIKIIHTPELIHFGKKVCGYCGKYKAWLSKNFERYNRIDYLLTKKLTPGDIKFLISIRRRNNLTKEQEKYYKHISELFK